MQLKLPDIHFTSKWSWNPCHHKYQGGENIEELVNWPWWRFRLHKVQMSPRQGNKACRYILYSKRGAAYIFDLHLNWDRRQYDYPTAQEEVKRWMLAVWGEDILREKRERSLRFLEEALELVQAVGLSKEDVLAQVKYTYERDIGDIEEELGQTQFTFLALAACFDIDSYESYLEVYRVACTPERIEKVKAKNVLKRNAGL